MRTNTPPLSAAGRRACTALCVVAALLVGCAGDTEEDTIPPVAGTDTSGAEVGDPGVAPVTDIIAIVAVPDRTPLVGRRVALVNMTVQTVTGQNSFWIGPSPDQQLFVVRSATTSTGSADTSAAARTIAPGQTVSVAGVLRLLPDDLASKRADWSLSEANVATLLRERIYLEADTVVVTPVGR